jgi:hypothetical protein
MRPEADSTPGLSTHRSLVCDFFCPFFDSPSMGPQAPVQFSDGY